MLILGFYNWQNGESPTSSHFPPKYEFCSKPVEKKKKKSVLSRTSKKGFTKIVQKTEHLPTLLTTFLYLPYGYKENMQACGSRPGGCQTFFLADFNGQLIVFK